MDREDRTKDRILAAIKKAGMDLTIQEIAERAGVHRNTVPRWLEVLLAEKRVEVSRQIRGAKLYRTR